MCFRDDVTLRILETGGYDGPSLWHDRPVVWGIVARASAETPDIDRLLVLHLEIEALDRRLDRTRLTPYSLPPIPDRVDAPWMLAWATAGLQRLAGDNVSFFGARELEEAGTSEIVVECGHQQTGLLALRIALQQLNASADANRVRMALELEQAFAKRLAPVSASRRPTAGLACILEAARTREIPITSLDPHGLVRELGHGVYRRRLRHTSTSNTSYLGTLIAQDKHLSLHYLAECGLPVPDTLLARDAGQAVANARQIGFPVVVKPNDEGNSAGLHLDLRNEEEVRAAFEVAAGISRSGTVVVQRFLTERHYRVLVVGDRIVGIAERIAAHVVGDGEHSIRELAEIENRNPRRGTLMSDRLKTIAIDETSERILVKQGFSLDDVPHPGLRLELQRIDDLEAGGEAIIQTGKTHPDNEAIIVSAVRAMELDIAGVDLVATDIEASIWETSGGILEVNRDTGFALIQFPTSEGAIDPGPAVIESLFPPGAPVRVPLVAVTGGSGTGAVTRAIGRLLTALGLVTGVAVGDELLLGDRSLVGIDGAGARGKRRILLHPMVEMAVLEIRPDEIVAEGLAFERCDVAVVTSLSGMAPAGLPEAESVICRVVTPEGVLVVAANAPQAVELARGSGSSLVLYGCADDADTIDWHRADGGRAVWLQSKSGTSELVIDWAEGRLETAPLPGRIEGRGRVVAAGFAAVLALGLPRDAVLQLARDGGTFLQVG